MKKILFTLALCTAIFSVSLLLLEIALRILGFNDTYGESIGQGYTSYYNQKLDTWHWLGTPHAARTETNVDFTYKATANSLGLYEREISAVFSDSSRKRVIVLGDSFTEGAGAVPDSSYPRQLERRMPQAAFYNAGKSGSDPWFGYVLLRDKLLAYNPDIVIQAINPSDYSDYNFRGGFERFHADGTTQFRKSPYCESCYHYSYIYRLFITLREAANFPDDLPYQEIAGQICVAADSFATLAAKHHFKMLFLLHPGHCHDLGRENNYFEKILIAQLASDLHDKGHAVINIYPDMDSVINAANELEYGFEHDGHFNAKGYRLMAKIISRKMLIE